MTNKKILIAGCSFAADCGFTGNNLEKYHWPFLLQRHYDIDITNVALGGMPNDEIFYRVVDQINQNKYDLVIVMWTGINRKWVYFSNKNIDEATHINYGTQLFGLEYNTSEVKEYTKLHYTYFNNQFIEFRNWYLKIRALEMLFLHSGQKYIFIRGFDDLYPAIYLHDHKTKIVFLFKLLNFYDESVKIDTFQDLFNCHSIHKDEIVKKISELKSIVNSVDTENWLEYDNYSFLGSIVDEADDLMHPGPLTNKILVDKIITQIDHKNLLQSA